MLVPTNDLLLAAQQGSYAIGAFNIYNLEGAQAVVNAAEQNSSPAMLQIHPAALAYAGPALVALSITAASEASVPMAVHLDHSVSDSAIQKAIATGFSSVMADGSHLEFEQNVAFTQAMVTFAHEHGAAVEAELGRISGTEDGLTVPEFEARFTDPDQALSFVQQTGIDALAVCIGNVHGRYHREPKLDLARLTLIDELVDVPLVLHGASGLPDGMVQEAIARGIVKLNVNTEIRQAFLGSMRERFVHDPPPDLVDLLDIAVGAMIKVIAAKLRLFGSVNKA
jgi:tagatose 1,6-diphosphate aldolase GatY/KbaY